MLWIYWSVWLRIIFQGKVIFFTKLIFPLGGWLVQKILIASQKNQIPQNLKYFGNGTWLLCTYEFLSQILSK